MGSWVAWNYDELRAVENRLIGHERSTELVELLSAHNFSIGYGPSARAVALIERIDRYLQSERFSDTERGRLHLLAALAAIAARQPDRMTAGAAAAIALPRDADATVDLAMAYTVEALPMSVRVRPEALAHLQEAAALAESYGATAVANFALAYRVSKMVIGHANGRAADELVALGERLRPILRCRAMRVSPDEDRGTIHRPPLRSQ